MQQSEELKLAIRAAKKAAGIVKKGFRQALEIREKANNEGVVTQIDHQSEEIIIKILKGSSSYPVLAEESGASGKLGDTFWVIDPLDGTRNFSRGVPIFAVTIALVKNGAVVLGVTLNPLTGDLYCAGKGKGAYLNDKAITVSDRSANIVTIFSRGYGNEADEKFRQAIDKLSPVTNNRNLGSASLEMCLVADGSFEGYVGCGDKLWDYAAGVLLIEEAGGKVTNWKGNMWSINDEYILATNGVVHKKLLERLI